jgi:hypothetical protein
MRTVSAGPEPIRQAVASGEFQKALTLWEEHARRLLQELRSGTFTSEKLAETRDLVEWCRTTALCARSHAQARLNRVRAAQQYCASRPQPAPRISASG